MVKRLLLGVLFIILTISGFIIADIVSENPSFFSSPDENFSSERVITFNITQQDNFERLFSIDFTKINDTRHQISIQVNETLMNDINICRALSGIPKLLCFQDIREEYFSDITLQDILDALNNFSSYPVQNLTDRIRVTDVNLNLSVKFCTG